MRRLFSRAPVAGGVPPANCVLHGRHWPPYLSAEAHHLVPVAWQQMWQPPKPWPREGADPNGRGLLWDARTVKLCPTGHRNVHVWITRLMHACTGEDVQATLKAVRSQFGVRATTTMEFQTAGFALLRWQEAGGSLQALVAAHEWGQS